MCLGSISLTFFCVKTREFMINIRNRFLDFSTFTAAIKSSDSNFKIKNKKVKPKSLS